MNERPIPSQVQSFPLVYIAYFKILYNNGNYTIDGSTSGYYDLPVPGGIDDFVSDLVSYETPREKRVAPIVPNGFSFELQYNSYVLFHLESGTVWQYRFSADGIAMDDTTAGEYMNLVHVDQHGKKRYGSGVTPDPNNSTPPNTPFRVAYFSAKSPSAKGKAIKTTTSTSGSTRAGKR